MSRAQRGGSQPLAAIPSSANHALFQGLQIRQHIDIAIPRRQRRKVPQPEPMSGAIDHKHAVSGICHLHQLAENLGIAQVPGSVQVGPGLVVPVTNRQ